MVKKRSKRSRLRGRKTCGWGSRKKHRGSGSRGGKGMAGTGKRSGHHKTFILKYFKDYFGKTGFVPIRENGLKIINLDLIERNLNSMIKEGTAKKTSRGIEINLPKYKILGSGELKSKLIIKANSFSESAKEKIEKAGGAAEIIGGLKEKKKVVKSDEEEKKLPKQLTKEIKSGEEKIDSNKPLAKEDTKKPKIISKK